MIRNLGLALVAAPLLLAANPGSAAAPATSEYARDVISVSQLQLHGAFATANCMVWTNAEDLGVGPAQLGGMHGLNMNFNPKPLPGETAKPTPFDAGFAEMKGRFPTAPEWLLKTIEKNKSAIEAACAQGHETPFKVYTITARDKS